MSASAGIFQRLDTILIRVIDCGRSKTWYERVLGFVASYVADQERLVVFDLGAVSLTIWQIKEGEQFTAAGGTGAYPIFLADDAAVARNMLLEHGVRVEEIVNTGGVLSFGFFDPDDNRLEVGQV